MLKKSIGLFFELLFLLILMFSLFWHDLVLYAVEQGKGELAIVWGAQPVEKVLLDISFPDSLKPKLKLIAEIKQYAVDSIGINPSKNYSMVYDQRNKSDLQAVTACEPYSFKAKEWTFPILGTVSYKGFFNKKKAEEEILSLKEKGYDIDVYSPSGWSTLGWFKDPILSNMLYNSDGHLANLIIHELTHGTIYLKNSVTFNENLANFIGDKGAENFLIYKYGVNSKQYADYEYSKTDEKCFNEYILKSTKRLDGLYSSLPVKEKENIKKQKKNKLISEIVLGVNQLPLHKKKKYFRYSMQAFASKNAFFMAFSRYDSEYDIFEKEYREKFHSNLRSYLAFQKEKSKK